MQNFTLQFHPEAHSLQLIYRWRENQILLFEETILQKSSGCGWQVNRNMEYFFREALELYSPLTERIKNKCTQSFHCSLGTSVSFQIITWLISRFLGILLSSRQGKLSHHLYFKWKICFLDGNSYCVFILLVSDITTHIWLSKEETIWS